MGWTPAAGLEVVAKEGTPVPGAAPGTTVRFVDQPPAPAGGAPGQVLFLANIQGPDVTTLNDDVYLSFAPGGNVLVSRPGEPAPTFPPGTINTGMSAAVNFAGTVAAYGGIDNSGGGNFRNVIWTGRPGALAPVAVQREQVPGLDAGVAYGQLFGANLNNAGTVAFVSSLEGSGVTPQDQWAVFKGGPGSVEAVVRSNEPAPGAGPGVVFGSFVTRPEVNNFGVVAFQALTRDAVGGGGGDSRALYAGVRNDLRLVALHGAPAPATPAGTVYSLLFGESTPSIDDGGRVAFSTGLAGPGVNGSNDRALYFGAPGDLRLVAREGDPAPGFPAGNVFAELEAGTYELNDVGHLVFMSTLSGPDVYGGGTAIWVSNADGTTTLVAQSGDLVDLGNGDVRRADGVFVAGKFGPLATFGEGAQLTNDGRLVYWAGFGSGPTMTWALLTTTVPEPAAGASLLAIAVVLRRRRPR
jgi:hypothetical protein